MPVESYADDCSVGRWLTVLASRRKPVAVVACLVAELGRSSIVLHPSP